MATLQEQLAQQSGFALDSPEYQEFLKLPESEVMSLSSEAGIPLVLKAQDTEKQLTATSTQPGIPAGYQSAGTSPTGEQLVMGPDGKIVTVSSIKTPEPVKPGAQPEPDSITFIKPTTGETYTLKGDATKDQNQINSLLNTGWSKMDGITSTPTTDPELAKLKGDIDTLKSQLTGYQITDAQLQSQIKNITSQWDLRIQQMEDINKRRKQTIETIGIRSGSRWTGGAGGVWGGIVAEEEQQGVMRIGELEIKKNDAIAAAREAARKNNWDVYVKQIDIAQKAVDDRIKEVKDLNQVAIDFNKEIREQSKWEQEKQQKDLDLYQDQLTSIAKELGPMLKFTDENMDRDADFIKQYSEESGFSVGAILGALETYKQKKKEAEQKGEFTLGPGQKRFDAEGNLIAYGGPREPTDAEITKAFERAEKKEASRQTQISTVSLVNAIISHSDLATVSGVSRYGISARIAATADVRSKLSQLKNLTGLGEREKLKGTGSISDFEAKMLANSANALNFAIQDDGRISMPDRDVKQNLRNIRGVLLMKSGERVTIIVTDPNTKESKLFENITRQEVEDAALQGYIVNFQ